MGDYKNERPGTLVFKSEKDFRQWADAVRADAVKPAPKDWNAPAPAEQSVPVKDWNGDMRQRAAEVEPMKHYRQRDERDCDRDR